MLKSIFMRLFDQPRRNGWLLLELTLVFCLVWYITDYFFVMGYNLQIPSYRQIDHTWQVEIGQLPVTHPDYRPAESDSSVLEMNFTRVLERLRAYPEVEAVSVSFKGGLIGSGVYWGSGLRNPEDTLRTCAVQMIQVDPRYDYFRVFRFSSGGGKRVVSLSDYDWGDPRAAVLCRLGAERLFEDGRAEGKEVTTIPWNGHMDVCRVKGVIDPTKRFDYERPRGVLVVAKRTDASNWSEAEIAVRSREEVSDALFAEKFKSTLASDLRVGNFYLRTIRPVERIGRQTAYAFGFVNEYYVRVGLMLFFLVNILLCVMGSFWYRIRLRREEIGLRMALGAPRRSIRNLFWLEGICLLIVAMLPALFLEAQFVYAGFLETLGQTAADKGMYLPDHTVIRFILSNLLTWLFLATIITAAVWLPARKAASIAPADALHEE